MSSHLERGVVELDTTAQRSIATANTKKSSSVTPRDSRHTAQKVSRTTTPHVADRCLITMVMRGRWEPRIPRRYPPPNKAITRVLQSKEKANASTPLNIR